MSTLPSTSIFNTASTPSAHRATSPHRKIDLQSPADLTYLIANVSHAAREKLDKHLPPVELGPGEEDGLRERVEVLVQEYIERVFEGAKSGVRVNGMEVGESEGLMVGGGGEVEAFDNKLAQRVQALSAQIERETLALANLRRNAPAETAERFTRGFERQTEAADVRLRRQEEESLTAAKEATLQVGGVERLQEVQETWERGIEELGEVRGRLGGTVAKMEKAKSAVEFVDEGE